MLDSITDKPSWTNFNPVRIVCEPLECLAKYARGEHILLVTTPGFIKRGVVDRVKQILSNQKVSVWDGVKPNPDLSDLDEATKQLKPLKPDFIIGLGGGSAMDAAKVLATTLAHADSHSLNEVFRNGKSSAWNTRLPLIAIPTTAGTGSEVTPFATIWDQHQLKKYSLTGEFVYPDIALLDASLTLTLGQMDTLYPALDAISHALESLWNKNSYPVSRLYAYEALELILNSSSIFFDQKECIKVRRGLQIGSTLAGLAISQTKTAIAHAMSYSLTMRLGVPHGLAVSGFLLGLIEFNMENIARSNYEREILKKIYLLLAQLDDKKIYENLKSRITIGFEDINEKRLGNYSGDYEKTKIYLINKYS